MTYDGRMDPTATPASASRGAGDDLLSIGEVEHRTGLSSSTLRSWERRVGFPVPVRTAGGQRRYRVRDAERIARVLEQRDRGLNLAAAVRAVLRENEVGAGSLFADLRSEHPHLEPFRTSLHAMRALTWAIEDECLAHASRPVLFGCFQRRQHFEIAGRRWRELARSANVAVVLSDFETTDAEPSPVRVALPADSPMLNEWSLVCHDAQLSVALVGWEVPRSGRATGPRRFEALLTLEPDVVRTAALRLASLARDSGSPDLESAVSDHSAGAHEDPQRSSSLLRRFAAYAGA